MADARPRSESDAPTPLRVVFMGTPALAARILERLIESSGDAFRVVGVVTRPDRPRGRGLGVEPSDVARVAMSSGVPTLKPVALKAPEFLGTLAALQPDVLAVAAYGRILPRIVLEAARRIPINVHASLLPRHRGASPVEGAILAGDRESGVTIMRVVEELDAGPILLQRAISLADDETQATLKDKLAELGAQALVETLLRLARGAVPETPQDASAATFTKIVTRADSIIDWNAPAVQIERVVRAYDPWPVARTTIAGAPMLLWRAAALDPDTRGEPGALVALAPDPLVQCGAGRLRLIELQAPARKRVAAADFMRGRRAAVGARLGS